MSHETDINRTFQNMYPEHAGKITGMLLEIENSELLAMLDFVQNPNLLKEKVQEAVTVLTQHGSVGQTA